MNYTNLYIMETFCQLYTSIFSIVGRILLDHFDVAGYPKFCRIVKAHQLECTNCIINSQQLLLQVIQRMKDESIINLVISARPRGMAIGRTSFPRLAQLIIPLLNASCLHIKIMQTRTRKKYMAVAKFVARTKLTLKIVCFQLFCSKHTKRGTTKR